MALFKRIAQDPREGPGNTKPCGTCSGTGKFKMDHPPDPDKTIYQDCPFCNGTGRKHV